MAVIQAEYFSQAMCGFRSFAAVLPADPPPEPGEPPRYAAGPWPTLYLLHGFSGARNDWLKNSPVEMLAARYGIAVIMPDGENRFYLDQEDTGSRCGEMIGRELVEVSRNMFSLSARREDTFIGGLSMGGYGAIRNGLKYRDTFSAVLAFSSALIVNQYVSGEIERQPQMGIPYGYYPYTFGPREKVRGSDRDPEALAAAAMKEGPRPEIFIACGSEDFLYRNNVEFHEALSGMGYDHTWWVESGVHDFDFWNRALRAGLAWWTEKRAAGKA